MLNSVRHEKGLITSGTRMISKPLVQKACTEANQLHPHWPAGRNNLANVCLTPLNSYLSFNTHQRAFVINEMFHPSIYSENFHDNEIFHPSQA